MIRSTKHSIKFLNKQKCIRYQEFVAEYRRVSCLIGKSIWNDGYDSFDVANDNLEFPTYLDYNKFNIQTWLSARCLSSIVTQISGMIRSEVDERKRCLYIINKLKTNNESYEHLENKLKSLTCPSFSDINPELSSKNCDIRTGNSFDYFLALKSLGKEKICIPIKKTKLDLKWEKRGRLLGGFLFTDTHIEFRYDVESEENTATETVGIDQGLNDILTLSNGTTTPKIDIHGHSLHSILEKMTRKKKGSKSFNKAQIHRKNFIQWSINQINFKNFKEVRFEKIYNIGFGKTKSRKMSHWTNTLIRDKVKRTCEETKVLFVEQDSSYRSQRCSECGSVRKANRKGKEYKCKNCGFNLDSDINAARNHLIQLPPIHWSLRGCKHNLGNGFFWKPEGLFKYDGQELKVPVSLNKE
jgi:predicted RNA-binding Zn-ribbon protein involved in translation (DUF1610 family)